MSMESDKPINPYRKPETSAERHFAYLNSKEGEEEFIAHFNGNPIKGLADSHLNERISTEKSKLIEKINKLEGAIYELKIAAEFIKELINSDKINPRSSYLLLLSSINDILSTNKSGSINSQLLTERANTAKNCITSLRNLNKIQNNSNIVQIIETLAKNLSEFIKILNDLKLQLGEI